MATPDIRQSVSKILLSFGVSEDHYHKNPPLVIGKKIVDGIDLEPEESEAVIAFFDKGFDSKDQAMRIKAGLFGGREYADILRNEKALSTDNVRIEAVAEGNASVILASRSEPVTINLATIGTVNAVGSVMMLQAEEVTRRMAAESNACEALNRWGDGVESPDLHYLRRDLVAYLDEYNVPYNDVQWSPKTSIESEDQIRFKIDRLRLMSGDTEIVSCETEGPKKVVVANRSRSARHQTELVSELNRLETDWLTSIESLIGFAYDSSLDKIGRYITRETGHAQDQQPAFAAITASRELAERVDVDRLIEPIIRDMIAQVRRRTQLHTIRITGAIARFLRASIPADSLRHRTDRGLTQLERQLKAQIKSVVCRDDFETTDELPRLPVALLTAFATVVGGGNASTANSPNNRPNENNTLRSVALGAASLALIGSVYAIWREYRDDQTLPPLEPGSIFPETDGPAGEIDEILESADGGLEDQIRWQWTPNVNPVPGFGRVVEEGQHFPAHERFFGRIADEPMPLAEDFIDRNGDTLEDLESEPGDHPYCRCAWVAIA